MKALLSKSILVAVALLAAATWVRAQSQGDRPPGVDAERWIPISDNAGVWLMGGLTQSPPISRAPGVRTSICIECIQRTGQLMVKFNGAWFQVHAPEPPIRFEQLH